MNCSEILYPASVTWEINTECNHNCLYCYNDKEGADSGCGGGEKRLDEIANFIITHKPVAVSISGGEPLLMYEKLKRQIVNLVSHGICVTVYTNGSLITDEMAKFFADYKVRLMVSFPSADREEFQRIVRNQYTYDSVIRGLDILKEYQVNFQPNIVMTRINAASIEATVAFLYHRYSPDTMFISRTTKPSNSDEEYDNIKLNRKQMNDVFNTCVRLSEQYNIRMSACGGFALCAFDSNESRKMFGKVCNFGVNKYTITNQGDIRACSRDDKVYGNIFTDEFKKIREAMSEWKEQGPPEECKDCRFREACRGGCRMAAGKGCSSPVRLDCDADTSLAASFHGTGRRLRIINPFRRFAVSELSVVEDMSVYRISSLRGYLYANKEVADFLQSSKSFRYPELYRICNRNVRMTCNLIDRMLQMDIIRKAGR